MMARLRLLFAMLLLCVGTWVATLAVGGHSGHDEPGMAPGARPPSSRASSTSPDAQQFISFLTRERFVADDAAATPPPKSKAPKTALKARSPAVDKRRQQADAQLPWPLNLLSN